MKHFINTSSFWGVDVQNDYRQQGSDTLVVLLPGQGYTIMAPLMYYSYLVALQSGYDILSIEYGFQKANAEFAPTEMMELITETTETIQECLSRKNYQNIVFIGKSLGAYLESMMIEELSDYHVKYVYLTPMKRSIDGIKKTKGLVIVGNADRTFPLEEIQRLTEIEGIKLKVINGVGHDLENKDYADSIMILKNIMQEVSLYIND